MSASLKRIPDLAVTAKRLTSGANGLTWVTCGTGPSSLCLSKSKIGNLHSLHRYVEWFFWNSFQNLFQITELKGTEMTVSYLQVHNPVHW